MSRCIIRGFIGLIRLYQLLISPLFGQVCRFYPTCSHYAITALTYHRFPYAMLLIIKRLFKCSGWSHGGVDFVPGDPLRFPVYENGKDREEH